MVQEYFEVVSIILLLLIFSAAISSSETSLTGASKAKLFHMQNMGNKAALRVWHLLETPRKFIGAILLSNNLVNILASTIITAKFIALFGVQNGTFYATIFTTILVVIFGEIIPKTIAITKPTETAITLSLFVKIIVKIFFPLVTILQWVVDLFFKMIGFKAKGLVDEETMRNELRGAIDVSLHQGVMVKDERDRLGGILDLKDLDVSEVMVHRKDIIMMDVDIPVRQLISQILATPYTRIPLYRDDAENIIGVLHAKDILKAMNESEAIEKIDISHIMKKPWYIPNTTMVTDQLNKFLARRNHFAIVVDEYGAVQGLITLEDILEEIVGDIRDEHDLEIPGLRRITDTSFVVEGKISIRDVNRKADWTLPDENYTTIAGLVMHESRTIPEKGQSFIFYNVRFEILERERNQIKKLKISLLS